MVSYLLINISINKDNEVLLLLLLLLLLVVVVVVVIVVVVGSIWRIIKLKFLYKFNNYVIYSCLKELNMEDYLNNFPYVLPKVLFNAIKKIKRLNG